MANEPQPACLVCGVQVSASRGWFQTGRDSSFYDCPNCGKYEISGSASSEGKLETNETLRAVLSHMIWKMQDNAKVPMIFTTHLDLAEKGTVPDPAEQLDNLIRFLGQAQPSPGTELNVPALCLRAKIGCWKREDEIFIVDSAEKQGLVNNAAFRSGNGLRLTMEGWQRFHELMRGSVSSRTAFMAMPFTNPEVNAVFNDVFRDAVKATGFHLKRLDDEPAAGSIDDRLRVEIRMCRFLIADLTCNNSGAYWEAGYAEGMGKPVIYTCNKFYFNKEGTHFDTNHHQTVLWDPANPNKAADELKNTIRATLPTEAKMRED